MAFDPSRRLRYDSEERYAHERAYGYRPHEAARRANLNPRTGIATRYEDSSRVQARIAFLRRDDLTDEMAAEKRRRIEERLERAAFGDILKECATIDEKSGLPVIDWEKVMGSDLSVIVSEFNFDSETGGLTKFKRDDALAAAAQLRDMRGFKAPAKVAATVNMRRADEMSDDELASVIARYGAGDAPAPVDS